MHMTFVQSSSLQPLALQPRTSKQASIGDACEQTCDLFHAINQVFLICGNDCCSPARQAGQVQQDLRHIFVLLVAWNVAWNEVMI